MENSKLLPNQQVAPLSYETETGQPVQNASYEVTFLSLDFTNLSFNVKVARRVATHGGLLR